MKEERKWLEAIAEQPLKAAINPTKTASDIRAVLEENRDANALVEKVTHEYADLEGKFYDQRDLLATHGELFRQLGKIVFSAEREPLCLTELVNAVEKLKEERDGLNVVNKQIKDENGTLRQRESVLVKANAELREENDRQSHLIQQLTWPKGAGFAPDHAPSSAAEAVEG